MDLSGQISREYRENDDEPVDRMGVPLHFFGQSHLSLSRKGMSKVESVRRHVRAPAVPGNPGMYFRSAAWQECGSPAHLFGPFKILTMNRT